MRIFILIAVVFFSLTMTYGKRKTGDTILHKPAETTLSKGCKFMLECQIFETRDESGIHRDTVRHKGDYIWLASNGMAYIYFNGKKDSLRYTFPNKSSLSFGDTPFKITDLGNGFYKLFQSEDDANGEYNRTTYFLKKKSFIASNSQP